MPISPARIAAFDILSKIESEKAYSSILLPSATENLGQKDRTLCYEITYGVLRKKIFLDRVINFYSKNKKLDAAVRNAIRIGLYQLLFLDRVPAHSAINESVDLIGRARKTSAKGFVNAILRRATRESPRLEYSDEIDRLSVETSHPQWLLERWVNEFGRTDAQEIAAANNTAAKTAFRFTARASDKSGAPEWLQGAVKSENVDGCYKIDRINSEMMALAEKGEIYFQDEASQMIANSVNIPPGGRFFDACAAPGGKITSIAARHRVSGNLFAAGELHPRRIELLRQNCERQATESVRIVRFDAETIFPFADGSFDVVLVDAPCSGTGTIRHNPEIRFFIEPEDFDYLSAKQLNILCSASKIVRRGGKLIYSTCSLEQIENEGVCRGFLASKPEFQTVAPDLPQRFVTTDGFGRTWPHRDDMDGFFVAVFLRR